VLSRIKWVYLVVDEGHRLKNDAARLTRTLSESYSVQHRLLLTGTPLQNNLPELWALLNFLLPKVFNSVATFEKWFAAPIEENKGLSKDDLKLTEEEELYLIKKLHDVLEPFMLRFVILFYVTVFLHVHPQIVVSSRTSPPNSPTRLNAWSSAPCLLFSV